MTNLKPIEYCPFCSSTRYELEMLREQNKMLYEQLSRIEMLRPNQIILPIADKEKALKIILE